RLGGKTITYYLVTSLIAISIGLGAGYIFSPGTGADVTVTETAEAPAETEGVIQTLLNIIPTNPIESLTNGDILQIIFFAIFIGIGITIVVKKQNRLNSFLTGWLKSCIKLPVLLWYLYRSVSLV